MLAGGIYYYLSQNSVEQPQTDLPDSISAPKQPIITTQEDTVPKPVGQDLAPGTALINARIVDEDLKQMTIQVNEVLGYGSATPVIAADTELTIIVENYLKANPDRGNIIEAGAEIRALISYQRGMAIGESGESSRWSLNDLKQ